MSRTALLTLTLIAACSHAPVHKPGDDYLRAIKFEGNSKLKSKTLVAGLALQRTQSRGRAPDPYQVQVDADRIRGEYLRKGFLDVDVRSRVEREGDASTVTYTVEEGVRATTRVVIYGVPPNDPALSEADVRAKLALRDGDQFEYATFDAAKAPLIHIAEDAGYAHAKLDATVYADRAKHEALVQLDYTLGPKCTFGAVEITGAGELVGAVRSRLQFATGDPYSITALVATRRALYGLARFSTVQVQPETTTSAVVGVKIAVSESAPHELSLGGGFGMDPTSFEVRARIGYTIAGWPFPLDTFRLDLRPAYAYLRDGSGYEPRIRAMAKLERQDLFWTYAKGEVEGGYNYLAVEAYTSYGPRARLGFQTPLGTDKVRFRVGWAIERLDFRNISPLIDPDLQLTLGLDRPELVGAYQQALIVDLRDNPIEPRLGAYGEFRVAEGTRFAGGQFEYTQIVPELRGYVPIGSVVLAAKLRGGTFFGDVPVTERFFEGGSSSHRGFGERQLSPSVSGDVMGTTRNVPYGGSTMFETGLEARIPLTTWRNMGLGTVVFLDGGDVTNDRSQLDLGNLNWAIGTGLRLMTIVGPLRADLGYRLNRFGPMDPAPGSRFAFHLSLGEAF
jgi:translocation and assembly module TamA